MHEEGVVNELPAHSIEITDGWKAVPVLQTSSYDVYQFEGRPDRAIPRHRHPNHLEVLYVVSGEINLRLDREDKVLEEGDVRRIERDREHEIICCTDQTTLLSIFQPPISSELSPNVHPPEDYDEIFDEHK